MAFADPPPVPPPAVEVIRNETASTPAARRDVPLVYVKGAQTERAVVRYQIFLRTEVETRRRTGLDGVECAWAIVPFLQRVPCVETITGALACGEDFTTRLGERESGHADLTPDLQASCGAGYTPIVAAQARLMSAVAQNAPTVFDEDLAKTVKPELKAAGIVVRSPASPAAKRPPRK